MPTAASPFYPEGTVNVAATTTSASVALPSTAPGNGYQLATGDVVLVTNTSSATAFVEFGASAGLVANPATSMPIPAGASRLVGCGAWASFAAVVLASGTGAVYFSRGTGSTY